MKNPENCTYSKGSHNKSLWVCECGKEKEISTTSVVRGISSTCGKCNEKPASWWAARKFGKLRMKEPVDISPGSNKRITWICDCGREKIIIFHIVVSGNSTNCGECNLLSAEHFKTTKYGSLRLKVPTCLKPGSDKKVWWVCDCGKESRKTVHKVISGNTVTCGQCNLMPVSWWRGRKFGKLRMKDPESCIWACGSAKRMEWVCDCGRLTEAKMYHVTAGRILSCGKCNILSAEHFQNTKFGKLRMKDPIDSLPNSARKVIWLCDCGKESRIPIMQVTSGGSTSCNRCEYYLSDWWSRQKFNKLRMKEPKDYHFLSSKKVPWLCDCGQESLIMISAVVRNRAKSCGNCMKMAHKWREENFDMLMSLKTPIQIEEFPKGMMTPLETIRNAKKPFRALCGFCSQEYKPALGDIKRKPLGYSLTCGCASNLISKPVSDISEFIQSVGLAVEFEYRIGKFKYDIFVPSHSLLIEYNGLRWHSMEKSKDRDFEKYQLAVDTGLRYFSIFEDEWLSSEQKVLNYLRSILWPPGSGSVIINSISTSEANIFYENNHILGSVPNDVISFGMFDGIRLIGSISFTFSNNEIELLRICGDILLWKDFLINSYKPILISACSDNRLTNGHEFKSNGFVHRNDIDREYYWVKSNKRFKKNSPPSYVDELRTLEAQGYKKIWDLGKKRWTLFLS